MTKLFISPWKLFWFSRYFSFCLDFLVMCKSGLVRKMRLFSKFMTSKPGEQAIAIHILLNISKRKDNQAMKFGQLIEYNMRWETLFLKNHTWNVVEKLFSDSFLKNQNWAYLSINSLKLYTVCFHCMQSWWLPKYIKTKLQTTCFYLM